MVSGRVVERRQSQAYSLSEVRDAVAHKQWGYGGRDVQAQVANELGLTQDGVARLLHGLCEGEFDGSLRFADSPHWHDVYLTTHRNSPDPRKLVYVKFFMINAVVCLKLVSCHPPR